MRICDRSSRFMYRRRRRWDFSGTTFLQWLRSGCVCFSVFVLARVLLTHFNSLAFSCRNDVVPVGVDLPCGEEGSIEAIAHFETALARSNASGVKIKAVMLCNPHNPLG